MVEAKTPLIAHGASKSYLTSPPVLSRERQTEVFSHQMIAQGASISYPVSPPVLSREQQTEVLSLVHIASHQYPIFWSNCTISLILSRERQITIPHARTS